MTNLILFKDLKDKGYKYVTIDGNNRDRCIAEFVQDGFPLTQKEYEIDDGTDLTFFKAKKENKYYSQLLTKHLRLTPFSCAHQASPRQQ